MSDMVSLDLAELSAAQRRVMATVLMTAGSDEWMDDPLVALTLGRLAHQVEQTIAAQLTEGDGRRDCYTQSPPCEVSGSPDGHLV